MSEERERERERREEIEPTITEETIRRRGNRTN
jgi:hypothetical protein